MAGDAVSGPARSSLRLQALLLLAGVVVTAIAGILHAEGPDANDHESIFATYAASPSWTAVHLVQFAGMALITFGLLVLHVALDVRRGAALWLSRLGAVAAAVNLALYGVLQAVDGVALKQAVDAWAAAGGTDKAMRFDAAETVRWMEWALRSYSSFVFGLALILFGVAIAVTGRLHRVIGWVMALSGMCYLAQGWIVGTTGFSPANSIPTLLGYVAILVWTVWLLVVAVRSKTASGSEARPDQLVPH